MSMPMRCPDDPCVSSAMAEERLDHFIRQDGAVFAGTHLIIEVIGGSGLDNPQRVERALRACVHACKATLLHLYLHRFQPQGVSGVAVLAESHISVHTCLLYTSPSPRDRTRSRMPSSA